MTDRVHSITVVLDHDMRDDDAAPIIEAIRQIRFVASATANISDSVSHMAETRAYDRLRDELRDVLWPGVGK